MRIGRYALASVLATVALVALNAVLFPLIFPDGLAEKFVNAREVQPVTWHLLGFIATGALLAASVAVAGMAGARRGAAMGALLGLLVALPEHLHLYAMTTATAVRQFVPVPWTVATWAAAAGLAGWVLARGVRATPD